MGGVDFSLTTCDQMGDVTRLEKLRKCIREAFSFFDKTNNQTVVLDDVGTIMRYLGQFPPEQDIQDVLRECMDDEHSSVVTYEGFEKMMLRCLMDHEYDPDDAETLLGAFRVLDPDKKGWIDTEVMRKYLTDGMNGFKEKDMSEFLEFSKDKETGESSRIYYEDYVAKLTGYVDRHIESLYHDARSAARA